MKKYNLFEMRMKTVNMFCFILAALLFGLTLIIKPDISLDSQDCIILILFLFPYLILHEVIHSIFYTICGANYKNVTYGIFLEKSILCCTCKQNITKTNILISLLSPFILLGVVTYLIGFTLSNNILIILSIVNLSGSAGDLIMFYNLNQIKDFEFTEYDNPIAFGLYTSEDLSTRKFIGLKFKGSEDFLSRTKGKKIAISKMSIIIIIFITLFLCITMGFN